MTVIDVNTGKFVGQGGNLEQTVTRNNLEAAEEIVRQLRLRDIGGIIVIDFIDMVLESNRDLVLRRLTECLGRDRTKHQVAEVTSLGLVQMTRKRVGQGLLEAFSEPCPTCGGRGLLVHTEPVDDSRKKAAEPAPRPGRRGRRGAAAEAGPPTPALIAARGPQATPDEVDVASEDHRAADEAVDTVEAVEPEADVTVRPESEPAAAVAAGIGELPPAVPDPNAGLPNAAEPVLDPDAPTAAAETPAVGGRRRRGPASRPRPPPGRRRRRRPDRRPDRRAGPAPPTGAPAGPVRRRVGAGSATSDGAEPSTGDPSRSPRTAAPPRTAPSRSRARTGVVAPGADTAEFPSAPEPVAGSNGAVGADGNGSRPAASPPRRQPPGRPAAAGVRRVTPGAV